MSTRQAEKRMIKPCKKLLKLLKYPNVFQLEIEKQYKILLVLMTFVYCYKLVHTKSKPDLQQILKLVFPTFNLDLRSPQAKLKNTVQHGKKECQTSIHPSIHPSIHLPTELTMFLCSRHHARAEIQSYNIVSKGVCSIIYKSSKLIMENIPKNRCNH